MSLLKMLDKLSLESIEDQGTTIHGDVELVVENETSADVSSVLAEVDQIENNPVEEVLDADDTVQPTALDTEVTIVQAEDELGLIEDAKEALEKFQGLLLQAGEDGISRQAAAFMHVGMESIDRILGIEKSGLTAALENYDASPRSAIQKAAVISLEDLKEKLKEAGKKALEIIKKIVAMIKQKIKDFNPKLIALDMRITKTIDAIKSLKAGDLKKEEIKFTPSEYMVSSSGFIANNPKTIADFMTVFSTQYVSALRKYGELGVRYLKGDKSIDIDQVTSDLQAKMAEDINKAVEKAPGNVKLEVTSSKSGVNKWEVVEGDGETDLHEVEVDVRALSKILAHLNILKGLVIKLQDFNKIDYKIAENLEKALADWNPDEAGMSKETARDALNIGGIDNSALVNYIAKCIAAQYTFIVKYELAAYGKETSKASENDEK
ncbi:hypothetical protein LZK84_16880 [Pseudomonas aeruginosa]|nr:hypothetical protein [Pseudomonas aeruginosa]